MFLHPASVVGEGAQFPKGASIKAPAEPHERRIGIVRIRHAGATAKRKQRSFDGGLTNGSSRLLSAHSRLVPVRKADAKNGRFRQRSERLTSPRRKFTTCSRSDIGGARRFEDRALGLRTDSCSPL